MNFSKSLMEYLLNRSDKANPFFLGYWLESLPSEDLTGLIVLTDAFFGEDESSALDDALSVILTVVVAETGCNEVEMELEKISEWGLTLIQAASLEINKRRGYIEISAPLSMTSNAPNSVRVTELGMAEIDKLKLH